MSTVSRQLAEEATWEKINNRVAWKLVEALDPRDEAAKTTSTFSIPVYSWLLLSPELRSFVGSLFVDAGLVAGIGIICGVWVGLIITWLLVQVSLMVRTGAPTPWVRNLLRGRT